MRVYRTLDAWLKLIQYKWFLCHRCIYFHKTDRYNVLNMMVIESNKLMFNEAIRHLSLWLWRLFETLAHKKTKANIERISSNRKNKNMCYYKFQVAIISYFLFCLNWPDSMGFLLEILYTIIRNIFATSKCQWKENDKWFCCILLCFQQKKNKTTNCNKVSKCNIIVVLVVCWNWIGFLVRTNEHFVNIMQHRIYQILDII